MKLTPNPAVDPRPPVAGSGLNELPSYNGFDRANAQPCFYVMVLNPVDFIMLHAVPVGMDAA